MNIKISSKCDEAAWESLKALAAENHQNVSGLLTEAVREYVARRQVQPDALRLARESMKRNAELGRRLAK